MGSRLNIPFSNMYCLNIHVRIKRKQILLANWECHKREMDVNIGAITDLPSETKIKVRNALHFNRRHLCCITLLVIAKSTKG